MRFWLSFLPVDPHIADHCPLHRFFINSGQLFGQYLDTNEDLMEIGIHLSSDIFYVCYYAAVLAIFLYEMFYVLFHAFSLILFLGVSGTLIFYSLGYLTTKFIGFIYMSSDENTVKISSVDFWGKRKDELISARDIVPFSDLPISMADGLYLKVKRFSSNQNFKLNLRFGVILDRDRFNKVFK